MKVTNTHTYGRAFSSGAVTTCVYDLGLSRLGFEYSTFRLRGQRSSPLRHVLENDHYKRMPRVTVM